MQSAGSCLEPNLGRFFIVVVVVAVIVVAVVVVVVVDDIILILVPFYLNILVIAGGYNDIWFFGNWNLEG